MLELFQGRLNDRNPLISVFVGLSTGLFHPGVKWIFYSRTAKTWPSLTESPTLTLISLMVPGPGA